MFSKLTFCCLTVLLCEYATALSRGGRLAAGGRSRISSHDVPQRGSQRRSPADHLGDDDVAGSRAPVVSRIPVTSSEYEFLYPFVSCFMNRPPEENKRDCLDVYSREWLRLGLTIREGAFVGSKEGMMFFDLLRCSAAAETSSAAALRRCVRNERRRHRRIAVRLLGPIVDDSAELEPRDGEADDADAGSEEQGAGERESLELRLCGVVMPIGERLTMREAQFYEPLIECSARNADDDSRQRCMLRYLRRWEVMGIAVPRRRPLSPGERILLVDLLSCERFQADTPEQVDCVRDRFHSAVSAGAADVAFVGPALLNKWLETSGS